MGNDKSRSVDRTDHYRMVGHPEVIVGPSGVRQGSAILSSVNHPPIILGTSSFTATGWRGSFYPKENWGHTERSPGFSTNGNSRTSGLFQNSSPRLSILSVRDDYRMSDPARKASNSQKRRTRRGGSEQSNEKCNLRNQHYPGWLRRPHQTDW
jgi:hypothetical protein